MDFISNLIKRPRSLARNDSLSGTDQAPTSSRPPTPQHSHSPLLSFERATTPEKRQQHIANALSSSLVAANIMDALNMRDDFRPIATAAAPLRTSPPMHGSSPLNQSPTQAFARSLQISTSSNGSCSSSNTSNTIEELLIQINDNLSMGGRHDKAATATELSHNFLLPNRPLSASPSTLSQTMSSEFNAICSKSANVKATSSLQSKESLTSSTFPLKPAAVMAPVTETATVAANLPNEPNHIDIAPRACVFGGTVPLPLKSDESVDKSRKPIEIIKEFQEPKLPELPTALNLNMEDRAKITFEDGLIPTLTAALNEHEKNENVLGKDEPSSKFGHHLQVNNEPDTATSSDNETFAECQSYQESVININPEYGYITDEYNIENSEIEAYFSAANSRNTTLKNPVEDPLTITMNIITEQSESDQGELQSLMSALSGDEENPLNNTFDEEPMDVDVSFVEIKEQTNLKESALSVTTAEHVKILPVETVSIESDIKRMPVEQDGESKAALTPVNGENNGEQHANTSPTDAVAPPPKSEIETEQTKHKVSPDKDFKLSPPDLQNSCKDHYNLNSSTTESASEPSADFTETTYQSQLCQSGNSSDNRTDECSIKSETFDGKLTTARSFNEVNSALNLTLDLNSTPNSNNSASSSPSFPIKQNGTSLKQFPRSPTTEEAKGMAFLEKSEYTERIEIERKKSTTSESKIALFSSRKASVVDEKPARTAQAERDGNGNHNIFSTTSNNGDVVERNEDSGEEYGKTACQMTPSGPLQKADPNKSLEKRRTFNIPTPSTVGTAIDKGKRRTFNIQESAEEEKTQSKSFPILSSSAGEKRRTFNIPAPISLSTTATSEAIAEPMDIEYEASTSAAKQNGANVLHTPIQSSATTVLNSPPIPIRQNQTQNVPPLNTSPPASTLRKHLEDGHNFKMPSSPAVPTTPPPSKLQIDDDAFKMPLPPSQVQTRAADSPPIHVQKRPSIHAYKGTEVLSAKERTKRDASDEKDVFAGNCTPSPMDELPSAANSFGSFGNDLNMEANQREFERDEFRNGHNLILNPSDFDYLFTKGNNNGPIDRSSILLKFDPLLGVPLPVVNQIQQPTTKQSQQLLQCILANTTNNLSPMLEEDEHSSSASISSGNNQSCVVDLDKRRKSFGHNSANDQSAKSKQNSTNTTPEKQHQQSSPKVQQQNQAANLKKHASMSVDVIKDMSVDNDCNKSFENTNSQPDEKQINYKMDELEKKIKNEVLKTEDIEKKLKEAEQREEALIKRITEKDKTITKMTGVIEAYEKAIAELIAEKEQLIQNYEKQLTDVKADRDSNYQHLTSLETTFADLHVKYGKSKEMTLQLKTNEEVLLSEKRQILENLRLQEQRYDKMKNHAMQQLEIANKKLESLNKEHNIETTKLKALLKKEEISRASISEQLQQKSRENAELVKICDELINGQGS